MKGGSSFDPALRVVNGWSEKKPLDTLMAISHRKIVVFRASLKRVIVDHDIFARPENESRARVKAKRESKYDQLGKHVPCHF